MHAKETHLARVRFFRGSTTLHHPGVLKILEGGTDDVRVDFVAAEQLGFVVGVAHVVRRGISLHSESGYVQLSAQLLGPFSCIALI